MYKIRQTVGGNLEVGDPGRNWQVVILTWSVKKSDACYTLTPSVQSGHAVGDRDDEINLRVTEDFQY